MSSIDKTGNADNNKKNSINSAETPYSAKKPNESLWSYRRKFLDDFFPDFKKMSISDEAKKMKQDWVKIVPDFSDEFAQNIVDAAKNIKCHPEDLAALLFKESRFDPKAKNGSFKGIGQMNKRSLDVGIQYALQSDSLDINPMMNIKLFHKLSREEQMPYVENYVLAAKDSAKIHKDEFIDSGRLYGLFYTPSNVKKRVFSSADDPKTATSYHANSGLDFNKDGKITAEDLKNIIEGIKEIPKNAVDKNQMFIFKEDFK